MRGKGGPENTFGGKNRGVRQRTWGKWVLEICMPNRGERIWIGTFDNSKAAALAYGEAAIRMFGATAKLNFPDQLPQMSLQVHTTDAIIDQDDIVNQRLTAANAEHDFSTSYHMHLALFAPLAQTPSLIRVFMVQFF
ncbi:Dehydration-responsive element-binding protein 2E [Heracleum sosnowskyi]|uniref:Dehydration-responsive element-binding protein 2E n=1 Tax=Heracleum sosnowskyi TaxID=360622 RepID=A0AAD8J0F8_9APIA|nr:Dehydration-responsive element-binding protein 2E [Heracleum sosnowskyi]